MPQDTCSTWVLKKAFGTKVRQIGFNWLKWTVKMDRGYAGAFSLRELGSTKFYGVLVGYDGTEATI